MAVITPTITTDDEHEYRQQMELIADFADGVHLDFADGELAPTKLLPLNKAWRDDALITHAHIMYKSPKNYIKDILRLDADLVILHAESRDITDCLKMLQKNGTRAGIALLPETPILILTRYEGLFDHVLIFAGNLGHQGGKADMTMTKKAYEVKERFPNVEISWDGGVNDENIEEIVFAGVSIVNVGSFLKNAKNPKKTYDKLTSLIS